MHITITKIKYLIVILTTITIPNLAFTQEDDYSGYFLPIPVFEQFETNDCWAAACNMVQFAYTKIDKQAAIWEYGSGSQDVGVTAYKVRDIIISCAA